MGDQNRLVIYIFLVGFLLLCIGIIIISRRFLRVCKLTKRLESYTIESLVHPKNSFGDSLYFVGLDILDRISEWLSKFELFQIYSQRYEIYITHREDSSNLLIEFIAKKFLWSFLFLGAYFLLCGFQIYSPSVFLGFLVFILGFFVPDFYWAANKRARDHRIEEDLFKAITIMGNSFKAGKSIGQALEIVAEELPGPLGYEFSRMHIDLNFGLELEMVLERFYTRVPLEDVRYITTSLTVLNRTGGNITDIFESIETNFLDRKKIKQELKATTASADLIFKVLAFLPFIIVLCLQLLNPSYFEALFQTALGIVLLLVTIALYILYIVLIHRIMKIEY